MSAAVQTDEHGNAIDRLETITGKINAGWRKSDDYLASVAVLIAQAKAMVEAGDPFAEGMPWTAYAMVPFKNKEGHAYLPREVNRLARIGGAPDPQAATDTARANTAVAGERCAT